MLKFDASYYLNKYPDVAAAVAAGQTTAEAHFLTYGQAEGRIPNAYFNPVEYVQLYSDLAAQGKGFNAWAHYVTFGANEGRIPSAEFSNFDAAKYLASNSDLTAAGLKTDAQALDHYLTYGIKESRVAYNKDGSVLTFVTGKTFTLTANSDAITGTSGNDTIGGTNDGTTTQFSAVDSIDGGDGVDTLKLQLPAAGYTGGAVIKNVEKVQVTGTAGTAFDANGITGLTDLISVGAAGTTAFNNVGSVANFTVQSNAAAAQTIQFANAAVTGAADAITLTLNGAQNTINVDSVTADASGIETINIVTTGNDSTTVVTLASNDTSVTKLTIAGDKALTLVTGGNVTTTAATIDASALTGKLNLSGLGVATNVITGGTNDDIVDFGANFTAADKFDGKAGTDTLGANGAQLAAITTADANLSNIETLQISDDVGATATTINAALFGTINNFRVVDQGAVAAAAITVNGLAAATSGSNNIRLDGDIGATGGTLTFNIANATDPGTANAVTLDLRGGATTATSAIALAGVETVTIDTTNATGLKTFNLTDANLATLTVKGAQGVVLNGAVLGGNVSSIDASGLTGAAGLNVQLSAAATTGANVVGSGLADTVVGSNLRDIVNLGAGADTFQSSGGLDTVTLGAGADILRVNAAGTAAGVANVITVTDFVAGTDKINLTGGSGAGAVLAGVTIVAATAAMSAMNAPLSNTTSVATLADVYTQLGTQLTAGAFAASAADGTASIAQVVTFTTGAAAGTYLVINDSTAAFQAANDIVINITGVNGTVSAGDFTFTA